MLDGINIFHAKTTLENSTNLYGLRITRNQHEGFSIKGSLPKFANDGLHNANDFFMSDYKTALNTLSDNIGLNPDITPVNGFEFGVNIKLPFNPNNALNRLILHKCNSGNSKRNYKEFKYKDYSFKFYNKSELTKIEPYQSGNILRIEVKVSKMRYIKNHGVNCKTLSDLLDVSVWERLEKVLIETVKDCLFIDFSEYESKQLTDKEKIKYLEYKNPFYWVPLHDNRKKYSRERERCNKFIERHSRSTLKTDILNLIRSKCSELRDVSKTNDILQTWDKITVFNTDPFTTNWDIITIKMNSDFVPPEQIGQIGHPKRENQLNYGIVPPAPADPTNVKRCISCGRIMPNPRKGQLYCSANDVGYVEAHRCRNFNSNPRNNTKKSIRRVLSIPLMFDLSETIAPDKRMYL